MSVGSGGSGGGYVRARVRLRRAGRRGVRRRTRIAARAHNAATTQRRARRTPWRSAAPSHARCAASHPRTACLRTTTRLDT